MKKSHKVESLLASLPLHAMTAPEGADARYAGYFACFNTQRYYEAHDVLEDLWLERRDEAGTSDSDFYKGLIQFAGAFVHLQKQYLRPAHAKDGARVRPALRLLRLAAKNIENYQPRKLGLDVQALLHMISALAALIERTDFANPWTPETAPQLLIDP